MPRVRCRVCDGYGVIGQDNKTCPECNGKGYIYQPQWVIDKEKEQSQDRKREFIVSVEDREPKERHDEFPPFRVALVFVSAVVGVLAWLFRLFGLTFQQWPTLKYLCSVPFGVILLVFLPDIIRWARKRSEHR